MGLPERRTIEALQGIALPERSREVAQVCGLAIRELLLGSL